MTLARIHIGRLFLASALVMLLIGLLLGLLASQSYIFPGLFKETLGFISIRPMHVSSVMFWIILGGTGCVLTSLQLLTQKEPNRGLQWAQLCLWVIAIVGVFYSYFTKKFGGREYWEFDPVWALPIAGAWLLFLVNFIRSVVRIQNWPVYVWMWMTGVLFFLFTFIENYLWLIPYFRQHFVTDMTIQWKVNGSLVGSWNQILYGTTFFLMDRIQNSKNTGTSKLAFAMYFLGLFNLMFNWGHHIYTLPTEKYVRYIGYGVSMTEWIIFARIIFQWKKSVSEIQKHYHYFPYRFLMAADIWVFLNIGQALLLSIPAINIYTHGTHVTVAHAMGTTIGINSMILLAACFEFLGGECYSFATSRKPLNRLFWLTQGSLVVFWLSLNIAGIKKGIWLMSANRSPFGEMMKDLQPWFIMFAIAGFILMCALSGLGLTILNAYYRCESLKLKSAKTNNYHLNGQVITNNHWARR
jgi:nitric oxide reductase subunit B